MQKFRFILSLTNVGVKKSFLYQKSKGDNVKRGSLKTPLN
jgi:hypothetical protein